MNFIRIVLIFFLFTLSINATQKIESKSQIQFLSKISLATEEWPPFSFMNNETHEIQGLSTDILKETFKMMGVKIEKNDLMSWARTQEMGYQGQYNAIYTASKNKEREKYMYFPKEPLVRSQWVLFSRKSDRDILKFDDYDFLKEKTFCLVAGYNYPSFFKEYISRHARITTVSQEDLNIAKLIHGRCDYMPAVLETTLDVIRKDKYLRSIDAAKKIFYFKTPLLTSDFYIMFSKQNVSKDFVEKFSKTLVKFKQTTKYKKLIQKYLHH